MIHPESIAFLEKPYTRLDRTPNIDYRTNIIQISSAVAAVVR
jgi:hypothetical protein